MKYHVSSGHFFIASVCVFSSSTFHFLTISPNCLAVSLKTSSFFVIRERLSANFLSSVCFKFLFLILRAR